MEITAESQRLMYTNKLIGIDFSISYKKPKYFSKCEKTKWWWWLVVVVVVVRVVVVMVQKCLEAKSREITKWCMVILMIGAHNNDTTNGWAREFS